MNTHDSGRFVAESIDSAVKRYKTLGFSIIPLNGARFPQRAKQPAIRWARYQHTPPTDAELHKWFCEDQHAALGVVCGRVSRLLVVDFDDAAEASEFRRFMPELAKTYTVRSGTRGLPHFYYRLSPAQLVATQSFGKVDLRGEGSYVVAPPTVVGEARWEPVSDDEIRPISDAEVRRLLVYLRAAAERVNRVDSEVSGGEVSEFRRFTDQVRNVGSEDVDTSIPRISASLDTGDLFTVTGEELSDLYRKHAIVGRNRALFKAACLARDAGWLVHATVALLAPLHAHQTGSVSEPVDVRYAEAVRTIQSAYKRSPRLRKSAQSSPVSNALRECLLVQGLVAVARLLDGLFMAGMQAGDLFTERQACQRVEQFGIGRRSVMAALRAEISPLRPVFESEDSLRFPPLNPPVWANAAFDGERLTNSCEMSRGAKRVKTGTTGRPAQIYQLPDPEALATAFGLNAAGGDALRPADLASPRAYRAALHRLLLERRPGQYARQWLATRLGITRWTTRRYERAADIQRQPMYSVRAVDWRNAAAIVPEKPEHFGAFLEDESGKRYPAVRSLAFRLMKAGKVLTYKQQAASFYAAPRLSVGTPTPHSVYAANAHEVCIPEPMRIRCPAEPGLSVGTPTPHVVMEDKLKGAPTVGTVFHHAPVETLSVGTPTLRPEEREFWLCPECLDYHIAEQPPASCRCGQRSAWELVPVHIWRDTEQLKSWWQKRWREHRQQRAAELPVTRANPASTLDDPQAESCARGVLKQITNLSLSTARKLLLRYGTAAVEQAVETVKARANVLNPAGFLVTLLKSEHKFFFGTGGSTPAKPAPAHEEWVRQMGNSSYLEYIANADELVPLGALG